MGWATASPGPWTNLQAPDLSRRVKTPEHLQVTLGTAPLAQEARLGSKDAVEMLWSCC